MIMERKTIKRENGELQEYRYFISSLSPDITLASRAVRGHWAVESMHWHVDVTFMEDANTTLDKLSAQNLNIIRKWTLSILKLLEINSKKMSLKRKRFKASPHNGARRFGQCFDPSESIKNAGIVVCISHFSYCTIGAKDPPKSAAPIVRCCLNIGLCPMRFLEDILKL